jgi:hypothetical protein
MKRITLVLITLGLLATACGPSAEMQATVNAQAGQVATVNAQIATVKAQPPQQVTVQVPVPMTVQVPVTVQVQVTSAAPAPTAAQPQPTTAAGAATAAPVAQPTATKPAPTAAPPAQDPLAGTNPNPIYTETFFTPKFWNEFETSTGKGKIENTAFTMVSKATDNIEWTFNGLKFGNAYITAKTTLPDGKCKAFDNYGLVFRYKNNANFYLFGVSCDGAFRLLKRVDGVFETIVDFTKSNAVQPLGQRNILGVRTQGDQLSLYVNDKFLTTVKDGQFADGLIGFYVASRLSPNMTVVFDDVDVYEIK